MAIHKSGQTAPKSGQYLEVGPKGGAKKELTIWKGETFPLTESPGSYFKFLELGKKNGSGK
jgi:hypothetical protein